MDERKQDEAFTKELQELRHALAKAIHVETVAVGGRAGRTLTVAKLRQHAASIEVVANWVDGFPMDGIALATALAETLQSRTVISDTLDALVLIIADHAGVSPTTFINDYLPLSRPGAVKNV